ncbi:GspH/FimT family pseudopilin [Marinomonas balearica]|uniref:Type IV fimbrial biogenesis protein FimT n=1 Tax=Marinomonas balearica TaxID=491947 RepID=A0A4R6MC74_9GAMM|nr:GspH/FimT family protein [Marinomonas balearica]TDO98745.1 type IV fimbrial biogenesis protein FimT [Marinomonas balearica]
MYSKRAFSLWEVLCVLLILSFMMASTATTDMLSYYQKWSERQQLYQANRHLLSAIELSRSLALQSKLSVTLCGGISCDGNWSNGLSILRNSTPLPFKTWLFPDFIQLQWRGFPARKAAITFLPTGMSNFQNGSFYLCFRGEKRKRVVVNKAGRAYEDPSFVGGDQC